MQKRIATTTAVNRFSRRPAHSLLTVSEGAFAGRKVLLFKSSVDTIELTWAPPPYTTWSEPETVVSDCASSEFDAVMKDNGDVLIVFTDLTTTDLLCRRLELSADGTWTGLPHITVFTGDVNDRPSLALDADGTIWVAWRCYVSPVASLHVKSSSDGGETWGTGSADGGDVIYSGSDVTGQLATTASRLFAVYYTSSQALFARDKAFADSSWASPVTIVSGSEAGNDFCVAARSDGMVGIAWSNINLQYREYDGVAWGSISTVYDDSVSDVQLYFRDNVPHVVFVQGAGTQQAWLKYCHRRSGTFSSPELLDRRNDVFGDLLAYDSNTGTFADLNGPAQTMTEADMYHPDSGVLLGAAGDALFAGMDYPFRVLHLQLSTPGAGGTVSYSYWDGSLWCAFTPLAGAVNLTDSRVDLELWPDYASMPADWQKLAVNGSSRFWIRIEVTSPFTTSPIGSMANAITGATDIRLGSC
jgi:hypothetical protein